MFNSILTIGNSLGTQPDPRQRRRYRNIAELRDAVRDFVELLQCPVDRRKERLPEPRSKLVRRGTPRSQIRPAA